MTVVRRNWRLLLAVLGAGFLFGALVTQVLALVLLGVDVRADSLAGARFWFALVPVLVTVACYTPLLADLVVRVRYPVRVIRGE